MFFVGVGVVLILLNIAGIGPVGRWDWTNFGDLLKFITPFLLAMAWWIWSDVSGLNKRREMDRMEEKKKNRRKENLASLGMDTRARRKANKQQP